MISHKISFVLRLACERQTFLLAYRRRGTFLLAKRPSAAMTEEKRLPFAGYTLPRRREMPLAEKWLSGNQSCLITGLAGLC